MTLAGPARRVGVWRLAAAGLAGVAVWDAVGYAIGAPDRTRPAQLVVLLTVPGGRGTHAVLLASLAVLLAVAAVRGGCAAWLGCSAMVAYGVWTTCAVAYAARGPQPLAWGAVSKWTLVTWLAAVLAGTAPGPGSGADRGRG